MVETALTIDSIGVRGDGVGLCDDERTFVPFALPGETWQRKADGSFTCLSASPLRCEPLCAHFGQCGGCLAQHIDEATYQSWKMALVRQALQQHGIAIEPAPLITVAPASRRRCVLTIQKTQDGDVLQGYYKARSHELIDIETCPVLVAQIVAAFAGLREVGDLLLPRGASARVTVLVCDQGLDVDFGDIAIANQPGLRAELAVLAQKHAFVRLSVRGDAIVMLAQPTVQLGAVSVPPSNASIFLQAVREAEEAMSELVVKAAGSAKSAADLFSGAGTFSFALARRRRVLAVDNEHGAIDALKAGRDGAQGLKPIETLVRDLFREPLARKELEAFDCVVFDPPRAGAEQQARMLAKSDVATVVAVSCNPGTLGRDAEILIAGGYELRSVQPIDQFLYSGHVECVAVLTRPRKRRRR